MSFSPFDTEDLITPSMKVKFSGRQSLDELKASSGAVGAWTSLDVAKTEGVITSIILTSACEDGIFPGGNIRRTLANDFSSLVRMVSHWLSDAAQRWCCTHSNTCVNATGSTGTCGSAPANNGAAWLNGTDSMRAFFALRKNPSRSNRSGVMTWEKTNSWSSRTSYSMTSQILDKYSSKSE